MTFTQAVVAPLGKLTVLSGRASRKEFWSFAVALLLVVLAIGAVASQVVPDQLTLAVIPLVLLEYLAIWAVGVRRLHDANMSGFMLLVAFVPLVGLITVAILLAKAGDPGVNRFGPPPA